MKYIERALGKKLLELIHNYKSVLITGSRQVGKSTLLKNIFPDYKYVSLDDPFLEQQAKENGSMFMMLNPPPVIIDEVQHTPELFRYIKIRCDESEKRGLFCLSGSQQFKLMKNVSETLSGRISIIELNGFSLREIQRDSFSKRFIPTLDYVQERQKTAKAPARSYPLLETLGKKLRKFILIFMLPTVAAALPAAADSQQKKPLDDLTRLRLNCAALLQKKYLLEEQAQKFLSSQKTDGSWQDIDYTCQNTSGWRTARHLNRIRTLAASWSNPESLLYHDRDLGERITRGIEFWNQQKRHSPNWWWNDIYVPMTLGHIFIMSYDLVKDGAWINDSMPYLEQAKLKYDGQNRIWLAKGILFKAILTGNVPLADTANKEILAQIAYGENAGIIVDGSFQLHGPQLQFGNYGLSYLANITDLIYYFDNTKWELKDIEPFRDFVLNGMKWVLWKDVMDLSAQGRQIWKNTQQNKCSSIRKSIERLIEKDSEFAAEYKAEVLGNKMFFRSDFMVHRTRNFYASYRANSQHTYPVETYINGDNRLGRYLSDGILMVMRTGREYLNIAGCWEWNRLPGTTLPETPLIKPGGHVPPQVVQFDPIRVLGKSAFTGGVSDSNKYGAMIYTMDLDKVKAKKAVFFADNIIIALGCGIDSESPYPVATTVEQSLLNGEVFNQDNYFYHNNIGYSGKNIVLTTVKRKGDWNPTWGGYKHSEPDEKAIFKLSIDHGKDVRNGSYEYAIYPDTKLEDMPRAVKSYQVLSNNDTVQAVKFPDNCIMMIFHRPGKLGNFVTDSAGLFIIKSNKIFAADPTWQKELFHLTWNNKEYQIKLPRGKFAGSTVGISLK